MVPGMTDNGGFEPVFCSIVPPHVLDRLAQADDPVLAGPARRTLQRDAYERTQRRLTTVVGAPAVAPLAEAERAKPHRTVYDAGHGTDLPGEKVRGEGDAPGGDATVNRAYAGLGATFELFLKAYARDSIDGNGLPMVATVHYDREYNNAFWNGEQMVFGDGDGEIFLDFTIPIDVIGHELAHGVTQYTANLTYFGQPGALNESVSDVFGALIKQYTLGQTAAEADWLIGAGLLAPRVTGKALRSMKEPGTAYDDDVLGKDPQPATMDDYVRTRPGQRRRPHQLRHPEPRLLPGGHHPRRARLGAGGTGLVRRPDRRRAAAGRDVHGLRDAHGEGGARPLRGGRGTAGGVEGLGAGGGAHAVVPY
ncbi:hypothetical protein RKD24_002186 [Streptomyces calvus]